MTVGKYTWIYIVRVYYCRPYICNRLCVYIYPNECVYISYRVCAYLAVQTMNKQVNCYSCFVINGRSKVLAAHRTYVDLSTKTHCVHSVNINYIATADTFAACMYRYIFGGETCQLFTHSRRREFWAFSVDQPMFLSRCQSKAVRLVTSPWRVGQGQSLSRSDLVSRDIVGERNGQSIVHANYRLLKWVCLTFSHTHIWFICICI